MRHLPILGRSAPALLLLVMAACVVGATPPPPELTVTSPERGLVQGGGGQIMVAGIARPGSDGAAIARVTVNREPARLAADGSFTAIVDVPPGAMLLETVATSTAGGAATDARAVQIGELRPVGSPIDRAITATLSAEGSHAWLRPRGRSSRPRTSTRCWRRCNRWPTSATASPT